MSLALSHTYPMDGDSCPMGAEDLLCFTPCTSAQDTLVVSDLASSPSFPLNNDCLSIIVDLSELETQKVMIQTEHVRDFGGVRAFADWYDHAKVRDRSTTNRARWNALAAEFGDLDGITRSIEMILGWPRNRIDNLTPRQIDDIMSKVGWDCDEPPPFPRNFTTGHVLHLNGLDDYAKYYAHLRFRKTIGLFSKMMNDTKADLAAMEQEYGFNAKRLRASFRKKFKFTMAW